MIWVEILGNLGSAPDYRFQPSDDTPRNRGEIYDRIGPELGEGRGKSSWEPGRSRFSSRTTGPSPQMMHLRWKGRLMFKRWSWSLGKGSSGAHLEPRESRFSSRTTRWHTWDGKKMDNMMADRLGLELWE